MGKRNSKKSQTLPSSPSRSFSSTSSSSSDFEFTVAVSPRQSSTADELFYKGQLLPLHLSPRISMVRTLILASSSTSSSSDSNTTASRDSTGSSTDSHSSFASDIVLLADSDYSSRPSSVTEDDEFRARFNSNPVKKNNLQNQIKKNKYFSLSRFSSVFRKDQSTKNQVTETETESHVKKISSTAKEVIRKYLKKVKPLYGKISQKQKGDRSGKEDRHKDRSDIIREFSGDISGRENGSGTLSVSHSFSGNLRFPRKRSCASSCPSSIRSSPSHSGILSSRVVRTNYADMSSMEELQNAIQGAIAHCKNSMIESKMMD